MGRFKIYDPLTLVNVEKDRNHARCKECKKRLKNIMGNIKRHYEQMHDKFFSQSTYRSPYKKKKCKNELTKVFDNKHDSNYNTTFPREGIKSKDCETKPESNLDDICNTPSTSASTTTRKSHRILRQIQSMQLNNLNEMDHETGEEEEKDQKAYISPKTKRKTKIHNEPAIAPFKKIKLNPLKVEIAVEKVQAVSINSEKEKDILDNEKLIQQKMEHNVQQQIKKMQIVSLNMDKGEYLKCIARTVTELNMPLRYFDMEVMQNLLQPWTKAFGKFNSTSMTDHINIMANKLRTEISKIVGNRFICLKLDIANKKDSSIMVVNIQFIKDFEINVFTLGIIELLDDSLAAYLKLQIMNTLERYQIDIGKVYSITKDYGTHVKKSLKVLQEFKENDITDDEGDDKKNIYHLYNDDGSENLSENFIAHALHFVACDIIKLLNENISQSRDAVKSLQRKMRELNINILPTLDNSVRWSSTYEMIKSLLDIRQYVEHNQQCKIEVDWEFARKFEESFKPVVEATMILQSNQFIMGDLFREWLVCETELEELSNRNELALFLLEAMHKRKKQIMENEAFLAAIYLDPRFCYRGSIYLNMKEIKTAIFQLLIIFNKLKMESLESSENVEKSSTCPKIVVLSMNERYEQLERKAAQNMEMLSKVKIEPITLPSTENSSLSEVDGSWVEESLEQLQYEEKLTFNTNILFHWKTKSYTNSILAKIAEIALAVPATQVTVNKAFSALPLALTKQKKNLSSEMLESILLLKLNPELVKGMPLG